MTVFGTKYSQVPHSFRIYEVDVSLFILVLSYFRKDFVIMEKKYQIRLNATSEVQDFVSAAEKCDFDIDVFYNRVVIDAKSILGVLSLDLNNVLTVQFGGQNVEFESVLEKYAVA